MSLAWVWIPLWIYRQGVWQRTAVMNSLLKPWTTELFFFFPPPSAFRRSFLLCFSLHFRVCVRACVWWIGFQPPSINAISHRSCPILPQRHMWGDTDQRRDPHFRAMGLGCMQHKTRNGSLASDSYWCSVGLCVTKQADQHKHARHRGIVVICENDGSDKRVLREFTHHVCFFLFPPKICDTVAFFSDQTPESTLRTDKSTGLK